MYNFMWIIMSVGTAIFVWIVMIWQILRNERFGSLLPEDRTPRQGLLTLGSSLVVLGIVFGVDRLISYSFIGVGVTLSIIRAIKSRRKDRRAQLKTF